MGCVTKDRDEKTTSAIIHMRGYRQEKNGPRVEPCIGWPIRSPKRDKRGQTRQSCKHKIDGVGIL